MLNDDKRYKQAIDCIADTIVNNHCGLIETAQDYKGHDCPDTDRLQKVVEPSVNDLEYDKQIEIILLNPVFQKASDDERSTNVPSWIFQTILQKDEDKDTCWLNEIKCCFVEAHENTLKDCIADVKNDVDEIAFEQFWDNYDNTVGF